MISRLLTRVLIIPILWTGLLLMKADGKTDKQLLWQALIFSAILLIGCLLEQLFHYQGDPYLIAVVEVILAIGLVFLVRIDPDLALRQFWWANLGLIVFYGVLFGLRNYRLLGSFRYLWGLLAVVLLLVTFLFGVTRGGATSWFGIGGFTVEPEEFVKLALLLFLASYLGEHQEILRVGTRQFGRFSLPDWHTLGPFVLMAVFILGLLAAQKSLGTALVFCSLFILLLYVVTERSLYLGLSLPLLIITFVAGYFLFDHVRLRVKVWLDPWQDPTGGGYQIAQSLFAIGGGKIFGTGFGNGIGAAQVPTASTDFIFSVIAEELGFTGAMALLCFFLILVMRAFVISFKAPDRFGQIIAAGIGILLGTETMIILAGVTKLLPLTGIPLPWVSYGGSSLSVHFLLLGLLANISQSAEESAQRKKRGREYAA
ncbi:MAG TPA: FtsW/RodA/SpoVE family cell cycle protein [Desulfitobacteriaceae bacterium]|jgi:cell division protein FtsW (lipid II flippase)|nr:FtsW/RodA/SpoVE family cell cycle protein [Desulfitobacteriaceae bacterium]